MSERTAASRPLDREAARKRVGRAATSALGVVLGSIALLGVLTVWHLIRRGRLLRRMAGTDLRRRVLDPREGSGVVLPDSPDPDERA
jgi:hypothetical protein